MNMAAYYVEYGGSDWSDQYDDNDLFPDSYLDDLTSQDEADGQQQKDFGGCSLRRHCSHVRNWIHAVFGGLLRRLH